MPGLDPNAIFRKAFTLNASDVHVSEGKPIIFRIEGRLTPASSGQASKDDVTKIVKDVLGERYEEFVRMREIDVSYIVDDNLRLRVNCHFERGFPGLVARLIPTKVPTLAEVGLTGIAEPFCRLQEGLIL